MGRTENAGSAPLPVSYTHLPKKSIWLYTGYQWEEIENLPFLDAVDVVVDGRFVQALYDISLRFRGSSNQRIIDVPKTLESGNLTLWQG